MIIITGFVKKEVEEFDMGIPSNKNNHPMKYDEDDQSDHLGNCIFNFVCVHDKELFDWLTHFILLCV